MESTPVRSRGPKLLRWNLRLIFLILVALLAAFTLHKWWRYREEDNARLIPDVPEPWAPPDYSMPTPTPTESDSLLDDESQAVMDVAGLESATEIDTEILIPVANDVQEKHSNSDGLEVDIAASRERRSSGTAKATSPLPDENFIPSASMPAMPRPNWEPPIGR